MISGVGASSVSSTVGNVVAGEDFGGGFGGLAGKEAAIVADDDALLLRALAGDLVGQRLAQAAHVVHGEAFADDGAPAAGAEGDQVLLLLPARAKQALLQDELGTRQVLGGVDALHFVLIVEPVALHAQAGADQLVDAVGETVIAIAGRRREALEGGEDRRALTT